MWSPNSNEVHLEDTDSILTRSFFDLMPVRSSPLHFANEQWARLQQPANFNALEGMCRCVVPCQLFRTIHDGNYPHCGDLEKCVNFSIRRAMGDSNLSARRKTWISLNAQTFMMFEFLTLPTCALLFLISARTSLSSSVSRSISGEGSNWPRERDANDRRSSKNR